MLMLIHTQNTYKGFLILIKAELMPLNHPRGPPQAGINTNQLSYLVSVNYYSHGCNRDHRSKHKWTTYSRGM